MLLKCVCWCLRWVSVEWWRLCRKISAQSGGKRKRTLRCAETGLKPRSRTAGNHHSVIGGGEAIHKGGDYDDIVLFLLIKLWLFPQTFIMDAHILLGYIACTKFMYCHINKSCLHIGLLTPYSLLLCISQCDTQRGGMDNPGDSDERFPYLIHMVLSSKGPREFWHLIL